MMKRIVLGFVILIAGLSSLKANAQNVIERGTSVVNVGVGGAYKAFPVVASYDYGIVGNLFDSKSALTLGGAVGTLFGNDYTGFFVGPRVGFHYHFIPELDLYATTMVGFAGSYVRNGNGGQTVYSGGTAWSTHAGVGYFFTPSIGVYSEIGYGHINANISLGVSFRF